MKILYLSLDPRTPMNIPSGGSMHVKSIVNAFRSIGHEVRLYAPGVGVPESMVGKISGGAFSIKSMVPKPLWIAARDIYDVYRDRRNLPDIMRVIDKFKPDAIYERNAYLNHSGVLAASKNKVPYFMEINAPTSEERSKLFGAPLGRYNDKKELERTKIANGVIVVTGVLKKLLVDRGVPAEKIAVFQNGFDPARFEGARERGAELRESLGIKGPVVGFVGSIAAYHGVERLFNAAKSLKNKYPDILFWIVGGGESLAELKNAAASQNVSENVRFEGAVPAEDVSAYMGAFDVAVLPDTAYYCSPIKLFEYGAAGAPVIAPETDAVKEIFGDSELALLTDGKDNLEKIVESLLIDPEKSSKMSKTLKNKVFNEHTWIKTAEGISAFMEKKIK